MTETVAAVRGTFHDVDWRAAVDRVAWIPPAYRDPSVPVATAMRVLRCTEESFARLEELGLPGSDGPDGRLYDPFDIKNIALYSGSGTTEVEVAMKFILGYMKGDPDDLVPSRRWSFRLHLATQAELGTRILRRVYRPMPELVGGKLDHWEGAGGRTPEVSGVFGRVAQGEEVTGTLTTRGRGLSVRNPTIRSIAVELVESGLRWHYLPRALELSPAEIVPSGAAGCGTLCALLEQRLRDAGFEATAYRGWIVGFVEGDHPWVEVVDDDGEIKYLDPSLALLAGDNGFGTPAFHDFVLGSALNRVIPTRCPLREPFVVGAEGSTDAVTFTCRAHEGR